MRNGRFRYRRAGRINEGNILYNHEYIYIKSCSLRKNRSNNKKEVKEKKEVMGIKRGQEVDHLDQRRRNLININTVKIENIAVTEDINIRNTDTPRARVKVAMKKVMWRKARRQRKKRRKLLTLLKNKKKHLKNKLKKQVIYLYLIIII